MATRLPDSLYVSIQTACFDYEIPKAFKASQLPSQHWKHLLAVHLRPSPLFQSPGRAAAVPAPPLAKLAGLQWHINFLKT